MQLIFLGSKHEYILYMKKQESNEPGGKEGREGHHWLRITKVIRMKGAKVMRMKVAPGVDKSPCISIRLVILILLPGAGEQLCLSKPPPSISLIHEFGDQVIDKNSGTYWFQALDVPPQLNLRWTRATQKPGQIIPKYPNKQKIGKVIIQKTPLSKSSFHEDILKLLQEISAKNFSDRAWNPRRCLQGFFQDQMMESFIDQMMESFDDQMK